jgi:hypothetical protein
MTVRDSGGAFGFGHDKGGEGKLWLRRGGVKDVKEGQENNPPFVEKMHALSTSFPCAAVSFVT